MFLVAANKNEFVLCIGTNGKKIVWTKVISWTTAEDLKVFVARKVKELDTLNMDSVITIMGTEVQKRFVKRSFKEFDYITVEPTQSAITTTFIITLIVTIAVCVSSLLFSKAEDIEI